MNKGAIALLGAAFLTAALGGCDDGIDEPFYKCQDGWRSAKVMTARVESYGQTLPVVTVSLFKRQGNIGSAASRTPIYTDVKARPTPAEIQDKQAVAQAYCATGTISRPE